MLSFVFLILATYLVSNIHSYSVQYTAPSIGVQLVQLSGDGTFYATSQDSDDLGQRVNIRKKNQTNGWVQWQKVDPPGINQLENSDKSFSLSENGDRLLFLDSANSKIWYYYRNTTGFFGSTFTDSINLTNRPLSSGIGGNICCIIQQNSKVSTYKLNKNSLELISIVNIPNLSIKASSCAITRNQKTLAIGEFKYPGAVHIFDYNNSNFIYHHTINTIISDIVSLKFSYDSKILLIPSYDGGVQLYTRKCANNKFSLDSSLATCQSISGDILGNGQYIITSCWLQSTINIYQKVNQNLFISIQNITLTDSTWDISVTYDGMYLAIGQDSQQLIYSTTCNSSSNSVLCKPCWSTCATCLSDKITCLTYTSGYLPTSQNEGSCNGCSGLCITCAGSSINCVTCQAGYLASPDSNGNCMKCDQGCSSCVNTTIICKSCYDGYALNNFSNRCQKQLDSELLASQLPAWGFALIAIATVVFLTLIVLCLIKISKIIQPKSQDTMDKNQTISQGTSSILDSQSTIKKSKSFSSPRILINS